MNEEKDKMIKKGYLYKMIFTDNSIQPLYVKTLSGVTTVLKLYPEKRFIIKSLVSDHNIKGEHLQWM